MSAVAAAGTVTTVEVPTSQGPAQAELTLPGGPGAPSFLLALTHGAGGTVAAPDLRAARDAALRLGGAVALITQPYRVRGARAPGSAARQDEAWQEIIASLRDGAWPVRDGNVTPGADLRSADKRHARDGRLPSSAGKRAGGERPVLGRGIPLIVGGRSNGARVACRTAVAVAATGVIALAFPLRPPRPRRPPRRGESAGTSPVATRDEELRSAASHGVRVLVVNGDRDPFGIPGPGDAIRVIVLKGESHALSRNPAAVANAITDWLSDVVPPVH
jgi:predicted alpha/beta-hydrolase family hydrolase